MRKYQFVKHLPKQLIKPKDAVSERNPNAHLATGPRTLHMDSRHHALTVGLHDTRGSPTSPSEDKGTV